MSLIGKILNKTPVSYAPRALTLPWSRKDGAAAQMRAYGAVGTLFNIVSTTSQAVAEVEWKLYRKAPNPNDRVEVTSHAALAVWEQPNKFMTRQELVESVQQHIDLTGEGWCVISRDARFRVPLELWPVRPDLMAPQPSPTDFIVGYWFTSPEGTQVPLPVEDVLFMRMPSPLDPYRGMGPVQSVLMDLDSSTFAAEWNRNFFRNSAQPGGIIEVEKRLTDEEFDELTTRWREQHQGVANAHRVAVIEQGKWVPNNYTVRDMQFVELRNVSKEKIREAFGFPKFAGGEVDDVNRATAEASAAWFARRLTVPRLKRWKHMLNNDFLPLFGATNLEFDYISPVLEDREQNNAERDSVTAALKTLKEAGVEITSDVLSYLGLPPDWTIAETEPAPPQEAMPTEQVAALLRTVVEVRARDDDRPSRGFRHYWD
ncbi:MAG TPA: phage portal protein [Micromonosporaceae bacterium]